MTKGSLALTCLGAVAALLAACTLTTTSGPITDVDGGRVDGGTSDGSANDGSTSDAPTGDGATTCGSAVDFGDKACNTCAGDSCCAELTACFGAPATSTTECAKLNEALAACAPADKQCVTDSRDAFAQGVAAFDKMTACLTSKCVACN